MDSEGVRLEERLHLWSVNFKVPIAEEACAANSKLDDKVEALEEELELARVDNEQAVYYLNSLLQEERNK